MGCDIHLYTEINRVIKGELKWVNCDNWKINHYYEKGSDENEYEVNHLYSDRNYRLFAVLADVRNYSDNKFICEPKGFPKDASNEVIKEYESWDMDGHSHSYFTLSELKEFRRHNNITKYSGLMTQENADMVDAGEMPNEWCQETTRNDYVYREWEREESPLDKLISLLDKRMREEFWIWDNEEKPEFEDKIRIVFWFDN